MSVAVKVLDHGIVRLVDELKRTIRQLEEQLAFERPDARK